MPSRVSTLFWEKQKAYVDWKERRKSVDESLKRRNKKVFERRWRERREKAEKESTSRNVVDWVWRGEKISKQQKVLSFRCSSEKVKFSFYINFFCTFFSSYFPYPPICSFVCDCLGSKKLWIFNNVGLSETNFEPA